VTSVKTVIAVFRAPLHPCDVCFTTLIIGSLATKKWTAKGGFVETDGDLPTVLPFEKMRERCVRKNKRF